MGQEHVCIDLFCITMKMLSDSLIEQVAVYINENINENSNRINSFNRN